MLDTPVVLIIFKRAEVTERVFREVAAARPRKLLVIADGPRSAAEAEACERTRQVVQRIDWDCELLTNFAEQNMGSPRRIGSGLNWVFSQVEQAIVLEDDCLPNPSFFQYCETLLDYYRDDRRVMHISGNTFQAQRSDGPSYYFSKYPFVWGWASWRRAWEKFDLELRNWLSFREHKLLQSVCPNPREQQHWSAIFNRHVEQGDIHWDSAWVFACWINNGLSILPAVNLVSNVGFGSDATRTTSAKSSFAALPHGALTFPLRHPEFCIGDEAADQRFIERYLNEVRRPPRWQRIIRKLQRLWRKRAA